MYTRIWCSGVFNQTPQNPNQIQNSKNPRNHSKHPTNPKVKTQKWRNFMWAYSIVARTLAIIRIPGPDPIWVKKSLDIGPQGIMFPMIESQKMAKNVVSYYRYPLNGIRVGAYHVVKALGYGIDNGYLSNIDDELLIICQVESEEGVKKIEKIEEIAAVDGVNCVHMGPTDLSTNMGYLGGRGNKKVKEMIRTSEMGVLITTGKGKDKDGGGGAYLGGIATPFDTPGDMRPHGYHMISVPLDIAIFRDVCVEDVKRFQVKSSVQ